MRNLFLIPAIVASFGALVFAAPSPASSMPAVSASDYSQATAGVVHDVAKSGYKKQRYSRNSQRYSRYSNSRNAYRPYAYRNQPYAYPSQSYAAPYYYRRPGINLQFGF